MDSGNGTNEDVLARREKGIGNLGWLSKHGDQLQHERSYRLWERIYSYHRKLEGTHRVRTHPV